MPSRPPKYSSHDSNTNIYMEQHSNRNTNPNGRRPKTKRPPPQPKVNPRFQDVRDTGKWGSLGKYECYMVVAILLILVVAVVVVVVVFAVDSSSDEKQNQPLRATPAPSSSPTQGPASTPQERLTELLEGIQQIAALEGTLQELSDDLNFYETMNENVATPAQRAAKWVLLEDPAEVRVYSVQNIRHLWARFGLATIYFALNGPNWTTQTNWLSEKHICFWSGLQCNRFQTKLEEIDLSNNNLNGSIPNEIAMLQDLRSIFLRLNEIGGQIPGPALASLESLSILYLNENELTGAVPVELTETGHINTLFLQKNQLRGLLPRNFCPTFSDDPLVVPNLGVDCTKILCSCCDNPQYRVSPCF